MDKKIQSKFIIDEMKSKTIGGRTVEAQIFIHYYDTSYCETPNWNGTVVNRIIVNDIVDKQDVGVPVYTWNGNGYAQRYYQQASMLDEYIHWIVGIDVVDGLKPIARCYCHPITNDCERRDSKTGLRKCGFAIFGMCTGTCEGLIKHTPID